MSAALKTPELGSEAMAFIKAGSPQPQVAQPVVETPVEKTELALVSYETPAGRAEEPTRAVRAKGTAPKAEAYVTAPGLAFTSLRLPLEIPHALMRAAFDRKLRREKPWTQQDIAAEALSFWLKKHGYL